MVYTEDTPRRLFLRVALKLLTSAGLLAVVAVFLSGMFQRSNEKAAPLRVDVHNITVDTARQVEWNGRPYLVVHRDGELSRQLTRPDPHLLDPIPVSMGDWSVVGAIGPALGCPLQWVPHGDPKAPSPDWAGGFTEACGGVWYDGAGRVLRHPQAIRNLDTPPFRVDPGGYIDIGVGH